MIKAWEDDPESGITRLAPIPDPAKTPLAYDFPTPAPSPSPNTATAAFRYWTAAEALRRGADFWAPAMPNKQWEVGAKLKVILDEGEDLNAYYDRNALNFFHGPSPEGTVYSGASPDIVCHEMGHAILDSIKPELWDAATQEGGAFHEAFGDMSAILSAIQIPSLREAILHDTNGHLYRNSRLSRLAEQLAIAIRAQAPDAVEPDCLRNAVNSFIYADPTTLPMSGPASQLSSEVHSFSRVFTGAFFESLAGFLSATAADPQNPTSDELLAVSQQMRDILVQAIVKAPVVSNFYAQVASAMVQNSGAVNAAYPAILSSVFVHRAILSLDSATALPSLHSVAFAAAAAEESYSPLDKVALPATHYGLSEPLVVVAPSHPRTYAAFAATRGARSADPPSAVNSAMAFVDALFAQGRVDYGVERTERLAFAHGRRLKTHVITREDGALHLRRRLFDCFCRQCE
jgi:hypothetical protein